MMKQEAQAIDLTTGGMNTSEPNMGSVARAITEKYQSWSDDRQEKEDRWIELWAHYMSSEESQLHLRHRVGKIVGDVNDNWRHHIHTGKAFSIIETAVGYLLGATFPNDT